MLHRYLSPKRASLRPLYYTVANKRFASAAMYAYRFVPGSKTLQRQQIPIPVPKENEVLVKILAAGLCHSDTLLFDSKAESLPKNQTFTMGHEGAGIIAAKDPSVTALEVGQYVAIHSRNACHEPSCPACSVGADNLCSVKDSIGLGVDGNYAEYLATSALNIVPVEGKGPKEFPAEQVAVATDAVLTTYHAMKTAEVKEGQTVLIIGAGGLGLNAVQVAKNHFGAKYVIACDTRQGALDAAKDVGADFTVLSDQLLTFVAEQKLVIDVACDFVGTTSTVQTALRAIRPRGCVTVVGLFDSNVDLPSTEMILKDATIRGSIWGTKAELGEVLNIVQEGKITPVIETRPMSKLIEAFEDMQNKRMTTAGRIVFVPSDPEA